MESTGKSRTYSPPRRESIEDHLDVLSRRADWLRRWLNIEWTAKLATPAWIRSLSTKKKGILHGPTHSGGKSEGPGVRSRFLPRHYRDLVEIIRLKSLGIKNRNGWVLHLWLRGHEYPMRRVRSALLAEAKRRVGALMKEVAPTGRFQHNINRRLKRISSKSGKRAYNEFLKLLFALMTRPSEMRNVDVDPMGLAVLLCEDTQTSVDEALPFVEGLLASIKAGSQSLDPSIEAALTSIVQQSPLGRKALEMMRVHPHPEQIAYRMHGIFADDRGHSRLLEALQRATDEHLLISRKWRSFWRCVDVASVRERLREMAPEDRTTLEFALDALAVLRERMFSHPDMDAYVFMMIVHDELPAEPPDMKRGPVDAEGFLRAWREMRIDTSNDGLHRA